MIILFSNTIWILTENITPVMKNYAEKQVAARTADHARWHLSLYDSDSRRERGVSEGRACPRERVEQGEGRKGGIKGGRERFLWCVVPWGQRGGEGLLPWQIWRCPVLLFLCSPSSCRKQHHAGHQSLGKLWLFRSGTDVCCLQM